MTESVEQPKRPRGRPRKNPVMNNDGYANAVIGSGTNRDRSTFSRPRYAALMDQQTLTDIYISDGFARKIVDVPAEEMTRAGIDIDELEEDQEKLICAKLEELDAMHHFNDAIRWSRLYGGSVMVVGAMDGGALDVPLNPDGIRDVEFLRVYDRYQATVQTRVTDATSKDYGKPELWLISPVLAGTTPYTVHNSRVIVFDGEALPDRMRSSNDNWGMSTLQSCYDQLVRLGESHQWANALLERSQQAVHSIKGLADKLTMPGGEAAIKARADVVDMVRGILNTIIIDADGETYDVKNLGVTGVTDLLDRFAEAVAAVSGIPVYVLLGRSIGGLNSSGSAERDAWYARIGSMQNDVLRKPVDTLVGMICSSMNIDAEYKIEFKPLSVPSDKECAEVEKLEAETKKIKMETATGYVTASVIDPIEVRHSEDLMEQYPIQTCLDIKPTPDEMGD